MKKNKPYWWVYATLLTLGFLGGIAHLAGQIEPVCLCQGHVPHDWYVLNGIDYKGPYNLNEQSCPGNATIYNQIYTCNLVYLNAT